MRPLAGQRARPPPCGPPGIEQMQEPQKLCHGSIGSDPVLPDQMASLSRHAMLQRSVSMAVRGGETAHNPNSFKPDSWMRTPSQPAMKVSYAETGSTEIAFNMPQPSEHGPVDVRLRTGVAAARSSRRSLEWPPTRPSLAAPASTYGSFGALQRSAIAASYAQSAAQQQRQHQQTEHRDALVCLNLDAPEPLSLTPISRARQDLQLQLVQRQPSLREPTSPQHANPLSSPFYGAPEQHPSSSRRLGTASEGGALLSHPQSPQLRTCIGGVGSLSGRWGDCAAETPPAHPAPAATPLWPSANPRPVPHPHEQQPCNHHHHRLLSPPQLAPSGSAALAHAYAHTPSRSHGSSSSTPCTPAGHSHSSAGPSPLNPTPPARGPNFSESFATAAGSVDGNGHGAGPVSLSSFASRLPRLATRVAASSNGVASAPSTPLSKAAAASDRRGSPAPHHANRAAGSPMAVRGTLTKHHAHHHAHHLQPHHLASSSSAAASAAHALALESALARKGTSLERSTMQGSPRSGLAHAASAARGGTWAPPGTVGRAAGWLRVASVQDLGQLRETVERDGSIGSEGKQNLLRMIDGAIRSGDRERPASMLEVDQRRTNAQQPQLQQQQQQHQQQQQQRHEEQGYQQQLLPLDLDMQGGTQSPHAHHHHLQGPAHNHSHHQHRALQEQEQQLQLLQSQSPFQAPYAKAASAAATLVASSNGVGLPYSQGYNPACVLDLEASDSTFVPGPSMQAPTAPSSTDPLSVAVVPSSGAAAAAAAASAAASPWGVFTPGRVEVTGGQPGGRMLQQHPLQRQHPAPPASDLQPCTPRNAVPQMQQQQVASPPPQQQQQQWQNTLQPSAQPRQQQQQQQGQGQLRLYGSEGAAWPPDRERGSQEHHMADAWHGTAQPTGHQSWKEPLRQTAQGYPERQQQQYQQQQPVQMRGDMSPASWNASYAPASHTPWRQQQQQQPPTLQGHCAQPAQGQVQEQPPPQHTAPHYPAAPPCPTPWLPSSHATPQPYASLNPPLTHQHPPHQHHQEQQPSHPQDRYNHHQPLHDTMPAPTPAQPFAPQSAAPPHQQPSHPQDPYHHQPLYDNPMPTPTPAFPFTPQSAAPHHQPHQQPSHPQDRYHHHPLYDTSMPAVTPAHPFAPQTSAQHHQPHQQPYQPQDRYQHQHAYESVPMHASASSLASVPPSVPSLAPAFVPVLTTAPTLLTPRPSDVAGRQLSANTPPAAASENTSSTDCGRVSTPASADPAGAPAAAAGSQAGAPSCSLRRESVASYMGTPGEVLAAPCGAVQLQGYAGDGGGDGGDVGFGMGVGEGGGWAGEGEEGRQGQGVGDVQLEELLGDGGGELDEVLQQLLDDGVDDDLMV